MSVVFKTVVLLVLFGELALEAQVSSAPGSVMSFGGAALSQQAPNTLVLGSGTAVTYDSNALNSQPPISNVQYTIYPHIGVNFARPRWDALINFAPGFSYSSTNLPQYQSTSLTTSIGLQYRPSQKLSLDFLGSLVSSTNPFANLTTGYQPGAGSTTNAIGTASNYLPKTNAVVSADVAYNLSARTSVTASASYNYISYQHDPNIPSAAQPFQQSNAEQLTFGLHRNSSPRYQGSVLYSAQFFDAGQGQIKTGGQSIQYAVQYAPTAALGVSAMIGPEYVQNTYAGGLGTGGGASLGNLRVSGWSWTGSAGLTWTHGKSQLSASASKQLSMGNQYQGNVDEIFLRADFHRPLPGRIDFGLFGGYNINTPVFLAQSAPRFSNNYLSTGGTFNKAIGRSWVASIAYWYLMQNGTQSVGDLYSGNHNRVAISLSYSITKSLSK